MQPRKPTPERRRCKEKRKATSGASISQDATELRAVRDPEHARTHLAREPGGPLSVRCGWCSGPRREVYGRTPTMNGQGQSDRPVVPAKSPNDADPSAAEGMEGRGLAKGNSRQQTAPRTLSRAGVPSALERVREAAERDKQVRFTALLHHVYDIEPLRRARGGILLRERVRDHAHHGHRPLPRRSRRGRADHPPYLDGLHGPRPGH